MPKSITRTPVYIASDILAHKNLDDRVYICDERHNKSLDLSNKQDLISIYERQVVDWFLKPCRNLVRYRNKNKGFVALMICMSYFEGNEQYRRGEQSHGRSSEFFRAAFKRLYHGLEDDVVGNIYNEARCGLFHDGMTKSMTRISFQYSESVCKNEEGIIQINPKLLLDDIERDFKEYLNSLKHDRSVFELFKQLYHF